MLYQLLTCFRCCTSGSSRPPQSSGASSCIKALYVKALLRLLYILPLDSLFEGSSSQSLSEGPVYCIKARLRLLYGSGASRCIKAHCIKALLRLCHCIKALVCHCIKALLRLLYGSGASSCIKAHCIKALLRLLY